MRATRFEMASDFSSSAADLWSFHMHEDALRVLAPPLSGFAIRERGEGVRNGSVAEFDIGVWPIRQRWVALHCSVEPGSSFTDVALDAPFPFWVHRHRIEPLSASRSRLTDTVWFVPPAGIPRWFGAPAVRLLLHLMFRWRHRATRRWLAGNKSTDSGIRRDKGFVAIGGCS